MSAPCWPPRRLAHRTLPRTPRRSCGRTSAIDAAGLATDPALPVVETGPACCSSPRRGGRGRGAAGRRCSWRRATRSRWSRPRTGRCGCRAGRRSVRRRRCSCQRRVGMLPLVESAATWAMPTGPSASPIGARPAGTRRPAPGGPAWSRALPMPDGARSRQRCWACSRLWSRRCAGGAVDLALGRIRGRAGHARLGAAPLRPRHRLGRGGRSALAEEVARLSAARAGAGLSAGPAAGGEGRAG